MQFGDALFSLHRIIDETKIKLSETSTLHSHGFYEMHIVTSGSVQYFVNGSTVSVNRGEQILFCPDVEHKVVDQSEDAERHFIDFSIKKIDGSKGFYKYFTEAFDKASGSPLCLSRSFISKVIDYYNSAARQDIKALCRRKLEACEIAVGMLDAVTDNDGEYKEILSSDFDIMLETFVNDPHISIREMSERLGYSERQISRKIKERYGKTLTEIRCRK